MCFLGNEPGRVATAQRQASLNKPNASTPCVARRLEAPHVCTRLETPTRQGCASGSRGRKRRTTRVGRVGRLMASVSMWGLGTVRWRTVGGGPRAPVESR